MKVQLYDNKFALRGDFLSRKAFEKLLDGSGLVQSMKRHCQTTETRQRIRSSQKKISLI